jgi:hypothetical protein
MSIITIPIPGSKAASHIMIHAGIGTRNAVKSVVNANMTAPGSGLGSIALRSAANAGAGSLAFAGRNHMI